MLSFILRSINIINTFTEQGGLKVSCHTVLVARFSEKMFFGRRVLVGAKFAVSWRTHSEHAVFVDNDVSLGISSTVQSFLANVQGARCF